MQAVPPPGTWGRTMRMWHGLGFKFPHLLKTLYCLDFLWSTPTAILLVTSSLQVLSLIFCTHFSLTHVLCLSHQSQPRSRHDHKNVVWWTQVMWNSESSYLVTSCPQSTCPPLTVRDTIWHVILKLTVSNSVYNNKISTVQHNEMSSTKGIKFHASPSGGSRLMGDLKRRWTKIKRPNWYMMNFTQLVIIKSQLYFRGSRTTSATHT